ncbi:MAG: Wadjet anti-phage system protein JetA family protein, partial [Chloroflexota bacterium]
MLFNTLPASLFHPFTAPGADAYANILADLFAESQRRPQPLSRDLALDIALSHLAKSETLARARDILNYLERCGWLRSETQSDFTPAYTIPDHAFQLLQTIRQIVAGEPPPLAGLMTAIHDLLSAAARGEGRTARLAEAGRLTSQLHAELKKFQHSSDSHPLVTEGIARLWEGILNTTAKLGEAAQPIRENFEAIGRLLRDI